MKTFKFYENVYKYYDVYETLGAILKTNKSFIRFGDGEYFRIYKPGKMCTAFEKNDVMFNEKFKHMYEKLIAEKNERIITCILYNTKHISKHALRKIDKADVFYNAYISRALNHPNMMKLFKSGLKDRKLTLVMSYIDDNRLPGYVKNLELPKLRELVKSVNIDHVLDDRMGDGEDIKQLYAILKHDPRAYGEFKKHYARYKRRKLCISSVTSIKPLSKIKSFFDDYDYKIVRTPYMNLYNEYDKYMNLIRDSSGKDRTILFFSGPVGKLMNYELSSEGYICWDMGHFLSK